MGAVESAEGAVSAVRPGVRPERACEASFTYRAHDRWAQLTVRVEPEEPPRLALGHALAPTHEVLEFWPYLCLGLGVLSPLLGQLAARVTVTAATVHPVDSSGSAFAQALTKAVQAALETAPLERVALPEALYPWVRTLTSSTTATLGGVAVEVVPGNDDSEPSWSARWGDIDPRAKAWAEAEVALLRKESPRWVGFMLRFGDSLRKGAGASQEAIALTVALALAQAGPVTRRALGLPVVDLGLKT